MSDDISIPSPTYRVPRHRGVDPATRRLALIAAGLAGALVVVAGGWSMLGGGHHGVPVIMPQSGPMRVKPANPGGMQVQGASNDIFSGNGDSAVDKLAPPPEVPDPQALRAPPPPPPKPVSRTIQPAAVPPSPARMQPAEPAKVTAAAQQAPKAPASTHPAAVLPSRPAVAREQPAQPAQSAARGTMVQLAALSTEAAAKNEWRDLTRRVPALLSGRQPLFSQVDHDGHVFWRVRTGGFADKAEAGRFCARVRAKGLACSVADF